MTNNLIEQMRNPEQRDHSFVHPSGDSSVSFNVNEIDIETETLTTVTSSLPCAELITLTIVVT